jgi:membrane protein
VAGIFVTSIFLIIFGTPLLQFLIDKSNLNSYSAIVFNFTKWWIVVIVIYTGITLIYRYGSAMKERIKWLNTGAILATILSIFTSLIFSFFINSFGRYNEIYGSIGALIVLLLWIQINVFVILIGFEFNASIAVHKAELYSQPIKENTASTQEEEP